MAAASNSSAPLPTAGPVTARIDGSVLDPAHYDEPSAAIGYVLEDVSQAALIAEESRALPYWVSNTHVEFDALIAALDHLIELGYTGHVNVNCDCQSVVQLADPAKDATPNSNLMSLYVKKARRRLDQFASFTLNYTRRKNNSRADNLADEGHALHPIAHP